MDKEDMLHALAKGLCEQVGFPDTSLDEIPLHLFDNDQLMCRDALLILIDLL